MTALLIDTCTEHGVVLLFNNEEVLFKSVVEKGFQNSKFVMPEIQRGLKSVGLAVKELAYIAVTAGPGSYTGIRVGTAGAKSLAYAAKRPLVALSSLDGFAPEREGSFAAVIDAKVSGAFVRFGKKEGKELLFTSEPAVMPLERLAGKLEGVEQIITPNALILQKKLPQFSWQELPPDAEQLAAAAREKFRRGAFTTDATLQEIYLREPYIHRKR